MSDNVGRGRGRPGTTRAFDYVKGFYLCLGLIGAVVACASLLAAGQSIDALLGSGAEGTAIAIAVGGVVLLLATWRVPTAPTALLGGVGIALVAATSLYIHRPPAPAPEVPIAKNSHGSSGGFDRAKPHTGTPHARAAHTAAHRATHRHSAHSSTGSGRHSRTTSSIVASSDVGSASVGASDSSTGASGADTSEQVDRSSQQHPSSPPATHTESHPTYTPPPSTPSPPSVEGGGHAAASPAVEGGSQPVKEKTGGGGVEGSGS